MMHSPRRRISLQVGLTIIWLGLACASGETGSQQPGPPASVLVTPALDTIFAASSTQLLAVARDTADLVVPGASFTWSSSANGIATVSVTGQVTAVAAGTAIITADAGTAAGNATVVVQAAAPGTVIVSPSGAAVATGRMILLSAIALDSAGVPVPNASFTWSSGSTSIATVRHGGFVTGVAVGTTSITASSAGNSGSRTVSVQASLTRADSVPVPLIDLGTSTYQGFVGNLYPGGNTPPAAHAAAGNAFAQGVVPLDASGQPSGSGKYVLLSIGFSNTTQEWCAVAADQGCNSWSFMGEALADAAVKSTGLVILDGAKASQTAPSWILSSGAEYNRVRDSILAPAGVTEKQVQVIWTEIANAHPAVSLPATGADALKLEGQAGQMVRAFRIRYPNLKLVFFSTRNYGGYDNVGLNPEPYAFENGFAIKWLIEAQLRQIASGGTQVDPVAGNLDYSTGVAPWVGWGPYLWARGTTPNGAGLLWLRSDFEADGIHPSTTGETKVAGVLLNFFKTSPQTKCWFLISGTCP
ncbi:MAG: Ig-like domain-containing protein [Gemmatimonadales bacterium]